MMPELKITCAVDGKVIGDYVFDVTNVVAPTKTVPGEIAIHFDPVGDGPHKMSIDSLAAKVLFLQNNLIGLQQEIHAA